MKSPTQQKHKKVIKLQRNKKITKNKNKETKNDKLTKPQRIKSQKIQN